MLAFFVSIIISLWEISSTSLENAYEKAYLPFIEVLKKYPFMKISIHYTGVLWDFFKDHHPEFIETLKELVRKGQLEMMTGGYYEPILAVIPDADKVGQIKRLTQKIQEEIGVTPQGMWLAERVWEPHLPKYLVEAGVEYISIDDYHFKKSGLREEDLHGYYLTEEDGKSSEGFPGERDPTVHHSFPSSGRNSGIPLYRFEGPLAQLFLPMMARNSGSGLTRTIPSMKRVG